MVVGESTRRLVAARVTLDLLGSFALKGSAEAVKAYRVVSLDAPAGATTAAFVGRDEELARIGAVFDAAVAQPAARLAVLLGSPGLGKSRLLVEVDATSLVVAVILFHPDDRAAASAELLERWVASGLDEIPMAVVEYGQAWNGHDLGRRRALFADGDDFHFHDHRRTGIGLVDADGYIAWLAALYEPSADVRSGTLYLVAAATHSALMVNRWYGTNTEGGAFETIFVALIRYRDGRLLANELFELDAARARFEELCAARTP